MHWPTIADHLARLIIVISTFGALVMAALLLFLVMRRDRKERQLVAAQATMRALTREIMASLPKGESAGDVFARATDGERLAAITHIGQLVRGDDRKRLTTFVEENHLLDRIAARARRGRSARRVNAVRQLGGIGGPRATETLHAILDDDPDPAVRLESAAMLAQLGALPPPERLIAALGLGRVVITRLHRALFRSLAPTHTVELLALAARDHPPALAALIVDALGWTEDYSSLGALADAVRNDHPDVRCAALRGARKINHPAAAPWVIALLDDPDEAVRSQAVRTALHMGLRKSVPRLESMRADPSAWVRIRVAEALDALPRPA